MSNPTYHPGPALSTNCMRCNAPFGQTCGRSECENLRVSMTEQQTIAQQFIKALNAPERIPMLLWCPQCGERHIDAGEFATKAHHTHACQECGHVWRPAIVTTVGVKYLPGFKDA